MRVDSPGVDSPGRAVPPPDPDPRVVGARVGDVLAHRLRRAAPRQDPHHGKAQDRDQGVARAPPVPGVGHCLQEFP